MQSTRFGVYFYSWYTGHKWKEFPRYHTPVIGEYDSDDPAVLSWQIDQIHRCGFDYVIFEFLPLSDWCFGITARTIAQTIPLLKEKGMGWTFMFDADLVQEKSKVVDQVKAMVDYADVAGWMNGIIDGPQGRPMVLVFAPVPDDAAELLKRYSTDYEIYFPMTFTHWGVPDGRIHPHFYRAYLERIRHKDQSLEEALLPLHYVGFWQTNETVKTYHGICPVIPSYDDRLLNRLPQTAPTVFRENGLSYFRQFQGAVASNARHILVYGWNEYFEMSTIEPTTDYGYYYTDLTKQWIGQIRKGETLSIPEQNEAKAEPALIPDAIRQYRFSEAPWLDNKTKYRAEITIDKWLERQSEQDKLALQFSVKNTGETSWLIQSMKEPIRLGARICDGNRVVGEFRCYFNWDIPVGSSEEGMITMDIDGIDETSLNIVIGMVYEHQFWFSETDPMMVNPRECRISLNDTE